MDATRRLAGGCKIAPLRSKLAHSYYRSLGTVSRHVRVDLPVSGRSSPTYKDAVGNPYDGRFRGLFSGGCPRPPGQAGYTGGHRLEGKSRVLLPVLSHNQKGWHSATDIQLEKVQLVSGQREVSDGDAGSNSVHAGQKRLVNLCGLEGCIPSCANSSGLPPLSEVCLLRPAWHSQGLSVDSASIRPSFESSGVYKGSGAGVSICPRVWTQIKPLHRRPFGGVNVVPVSHARGSLNCALPHGPGFRGQSEKVTPGANAGPDSLGGSDTDGARHSICATRKSHSDLFGDGLVAGASDCNGPEAQALHRLTDGVQGDDSVVHVLCPTAVSFSEVSVLSKEGPSIQADSVGSRAASRDLDVLEKPGFCHAGSQVSPSVSHPCGDDGVKSTSLWSVVQESYVHKDVGQGTLVGPYQCEGNEDSAISAAVISVLHYPGACLSSDRQCHGEGLPVSIRGNEVQFAGFHNPPGSNLVHDSGRDSVCSPHCWSRQLPSGSSVPSKSGPCPEGPMEVYGPGGCTEDFRSLGSPHSGSLCNWVESQGSPVLQLSPRPSSTVRRCLVRALGRRPTVPLSPYSDGSPIPFQDSEGGVGRLSHHSMVAVEGVVPPAVLQAAGVSGSAAITFGNALRPSSKALYFKKWDYFVRWCRKRDFHPLCVPLETLLDYLESLKDHGLKHNTIVTHVSALSCCLPLCDNNPVGCHSLVVGWLRGNKALNPPRGLLAPSWDLSVVLAALREAPFEPLDSADLKFLTWKTAFLLAITSVRRVSELHALCAVPPFTVVNPRSVLLRINPVFLPKTATQRSLQGIIDLKQFPRKVSCDLDRELRKNCPVRAVTMYLQRTKCYRLDNQFFVGYGDAKRGKAVSKQTLARWISDTIKHSYSRMGRDCPIKTNAHTTRGVAASWAELAKVGTLSICEAATWSSELTFARFYRLDFAGSSVSSAVLGLAQK